MIAIETATRFNSHTYCARSSYAIREALRAKKIYNYIILPSGRRGLDK